MEVREQQGMGAGKQRHAGLECETQAKQRVLTYSNGLSGVLLGRLLAEKLKR